MSTDTNSLALETVTKTFDFFLQSIMRLLDFPAFLKVKYVFTFHTTRESNLIVEILENEMSPNYNDNY